MKRTTRLNKGLHVKQGTRETLGGEERKGPSKEIMKSRKEKEVKPDQKINDFVLKSETYSIF